MREFVGFGSMQGGRFNFWFHWTVAMKDIAHPYFPYYLTGWIVELLRSWERAWIVIRLGRWKESFVRLEKLHPWGRGSIPLSSAEHQYFRQEGAIVIQRKEVHLHSSEDVFLPNIVAAKEGGEYLRFPEATICKYHTKGEIPRLKIGGSWQFEMDEILGLRR